MPAKSAKQRQLMAIALIAPGRIKAKNKSVLDMKKEDLKDFAKTPENKLPERKRALSTSEYIKRRNREKYG